jgi:serine/threonine protein kinase
VAVKQIVPPAGADEGLVDQQRQRALREGRIAARLSHPHAISVYDVATDGGSPWLVMEYLPSRSLAQVLSDDGLLRPDQVATIGAQVADALAATHAAGIVHRDVKPANVLVGDDGRAHLTDFGIATTTGDATLTTQGAVLGSPSYMSPQRANGDDPQPADDLWSVGATLYTAVEGHLPFDRDEPMATLLAVVTEDPVPMRAAGPLEPVLCGLLTKDPGRRTTVADARRQLEAVLAGEGSAPLPPRPAPDPGRRRPRSARTREALHRGGDLARFDRAELRSLASASKAVLGSVAGSVAESVVRETREQARTLVDRRARSGGADVRRRRRFKRRWVVVPVVVTCAVAVLLLVGLAVLLGRLTGLLG